jgi:uncharacterized SAM-binding protein YcdF (DUF218 family)
MWLLPIGGILVALLALAVYQFRQRARGRYALAVIIAVLYALSIDPVANAFIRPLETMYTQPAASALTGDAVILLGGGARAGVPDFDGEGQVGSAAANRFLTAVRIQKSLHIPILLSGGAVIKGDADEAAIEKRMLLSLGVDEADIYMDEQSRNTAENASFSKAICTKQGWHHPIVVTSAFHMPRAARFFDREGLEFTPYPCDYRTGTMTNLTAYSFIPQAFVLFNSCLCLKEYVGIGAARLGLQ